MSGHPTAERTQHVPGAVEDDSELASERLAAALDVPVSVAGVLFVLVVLASNLTPPDAEWGWVWDVAIWTLWVLFVLEFAARMIVAPSIRRFLRRNWWQALFLAVPFLRFLRAFTRSARVARSLASSVRGTRTAGRALGSRIAYLGAATIGVILASSQILFEFGSTTSFGEALHAAALSTISGQPIRLDGALARVVEIVLAIYAVALFATLAGSVGAFFLEHPNDRDMSPGPKGRSTPDASRDLDRSPAGTQPP
jgi:voltage-gated potassium channel